MFTAIEVLEMAIKLEENGERLYREALDYVADPSLRELLAWLADEEVRHRKRFQEMKASIENGTEPSLADQLGNEILKDAVRDRAFSLEEVDLSRVRDQQTLMRIALEFEQDGLAFYEIIRSFVSDPETLKHIDTIIKEEQEHVKCFELRNKSVSQSFKF